MKNILALTAISILFSTSAWAQCDTATVYALASEQVAQTQSCRLVSSAKKTSRWGYYYVYAHCSKGLPLKYILKYHGETCEFLRERSSDIRGL